MTQVISTTTEVQPSHVCTSLLKTTGKPCGKPAYYIEPNKDKNEDRSKWTEVCGRHVKNKDSKTRNPHMVKNGRGKIERKEDIDLHKKTIEEAKLLNMKEKRTGDISCVKLRMFSKMPVKTGYLNVYPNEKHANKQDGLGMPALSPKKLGPIEIPNSKEISLTLEGYHQFNKVYPHELDSKGNLTKEFLETRKVGYGLKSPLRHKFGKTKAEHLKFLRSKGAKIKVDANVNIPLFSAIQEENGTFVKYTYLQSRYWYCTWYQVLAKKTKEYQTLVDLLKSGTNLQICGYDGFELSEGDRKDRKDRKDQKDQKNEGDRMSKFFLEAYQDESRPFGHEIVLICLLNKDINGGILPWEVLGKPNGQGTILVVQ